ncbi:scavenger receptor [Branchiostoma belcheri]|nr:scavenger receptor [Branchiostoma belcheri]
MYTVTSATGCGGNLTAPSGGPVTSPNYPGYYGNNENCEWTITVPEGSIIRLTFDMFLTDNGYDFLTIYDGASDNATEIERLTGYHSQIIPIISTSNTLFLRFTSDGSVSYQGFQFSYSSRTAGQCWDPGVPANGNRDNNSNFTSGQTVRYTCMDGYQLWGTANITCQPNGTWSGVTPTCGGNPKWNTCSMANGRWNGPFFRSNVEREFSLDPSRIRLVDHGYWPHGPNEGLVEVRPADSWTWGGVCGEHFDLRDADVVCRMLGYISAINYGPLIVSHGLAYMAYIRCHGNESSLFSCSYAGWGNHDCEYGDFAGIRIYAYAGVVCDPSRIRLIGGSSPNEGRVEVRPEDSLTWGTVCHNQFDMKDADVVCRMLGYPNATQVQNDAYFVQGTGPIYMDDLRCDGNESSIFNCSYAGWTIQDCDHGQDAGVVCRTDFSRIRLVGGSGPNEGRVEVRPADSSRWGTVCHNGFDLKDAEVVCRMLGYPNVYRVRTYAYFGQGAGPIYLEDLQCDGTESSLFNCSHGGWGIHDCYHSDDVGVVCGSSQSEGRVEVRPADSMTWGTVCHNQFDMKDADVVCKVLGYPSAKQGRSDAYFGPVKIHADQAGCRGGLPLSSLVTNPRELPGNSSALRRRPVESSSVPAPDAGRGPIYMDDLRCNGDETSLFNCSYPGWTINDLNCSYDQAAGVECTELEEPSLLVSTPVGIFQIEIKDGSKVKLLSGAHTSLDYDPMTDFLYWGNPEGIGRARLDGSRMETIVEFEITAFPFGLKLDHAGGNVYWSDTGGHISVARKDGSFVRTLLTLQGFPLQLVLDPRNG